MDKLNDKWFHAYEIMVHPDGDCVDILARGNGSFVLWPGTVDERRFTGRQFINVGAVCVAGGSAAANSCL